MEQLFLLLGSYIIPKGYVVVAKTEILFSKDKKLLTYERGKNVLLQPVRQKESKVWEMC